MSLPIMQEEQHAKKSAHQMPATGMPHDEEKVLVAQNLASVRRKIGVHSGKGGVGKTFVAVNLALLLAGAQKKVGLLDADIDCPNVARFLEIADQALEGTPEGRIYPLEHSGIKIISSHFLTDNPTQPMIVRGPIKHKVLSELLSHVEWGELDALVVDLPPGTSDVPLSSMLIAGLDGIIIVTTPQKESAMDAKKSALMAKEMGVAVLGVIENMSGDAFGTGAGERLAKELGVPFIGSIPLARDIRERSESGKISLNLPQYQTLGAALLTAAMGEMPERKRSFWQRLGMEW